MTPNNPPSERATVNRVSLPKNPQRLRELYCLMLDLDVETPETTDELENVCLARGYLVIEDE